MLEEIKFAEVKVSKLELSDRKIDIQLTPDLLSNESFPLRLLADGAEKFVKKSKFQHVSILLKITEKNGELSVSRCGYDGNFFTTEHDQVCAVNRICLSEKDLVKLEILKTNTSMMWDDEKMSRLLNLFNDDILTKRELSVIVQEKKDKHKKNQLAEAIEGYELARKRLEIIMGI